MRKFGSLLFLVGLALLLWAVLTELPVGEPPMRVGAAIQAEAPEAVGAANLVTAVVLAYRGIDTLGELAILFTAALAAGMVLTPQRAGAAAPKTPAASADNSGGFILATGADLLFPLLLVVGLYIVLHGHVTPGGGFQGGVILAAAFFLPVLAGAGRALDERLLGLVEGMAGTAFIVIGLLALLGQGAFLQPWLGTGELGSLLSAGTLPLLYLAVGLKVGAELAGLLSHLAAPAGEEG